MYTSLFLVLLLLSIANLIRPGVILRTTTRGGGEFAISLWWLYGSLWIWWGSRAGEALRWLP